MGSKSSEIQKEMTLLALSQANVVEVVEAIDRIL
jgi:hypothetical protein